MYIRDGIAYSLNDTHILEVTKVKPLEDRILLLLFNNGMEKLFDTTTLKGPVFEPLNDKTIYNSVYIDDGVVTWDNGSIDCAPEFMYMNGFDYSSVSYGY